MAYWNPVFKGYTLSQRGLALRLECSTATIRRHGKLHGDKVSGYVQGTGAVWREHWVARRYQSGSLLDYEFVRREGDIERNTVLNLNNRDVHYLESIYRQLKEIQATVEGPSLGSEVLADNMDWLDCFIDRANRALI